MSDAPQSPPIAQEDVKMIQSLTDDEYDVVLAFGWDALWEFQYGYASKVQ